MAKRVIRHPGLEYRRPIGGVRSMPGMDVRDPEELEGLDLRGPQELEGLDLSERTPVAHGRRKLPGLDLREPTELDGIDLRDPVQMPELDVTDYPSVRNLPDPNAFEGLDLREPEQADRADADALKALISGDEDDEDGPVTFTGHDVSSADREKWETDRAGEAGDMQARAGMAGGRVYASNMARATDRSADDMAAREGMAKGRVYATNMARATGTLPNNDNAVRRAPFEGRLAEQPVLINGRGEEKFTPFPGYDENGNLLPESVRAENAERATAETLAKAGFDANGDPLKKAQGVVARAKKLPGSSRELSPEPERPQFARKPFTVSGAVANVVTAASPGKDAELEAARRDADLNTLAADLGEAGSMVAHAGLSNRHDKSRFNADRAVAGKPLDRLKEDRALADTELQRRVALEDKLRAAGRQAEADKLKAERERWEMKHKDASLAETARHNKAMEALARAKGENNTGAGRKTNAEQQRHDALSIVEADLDRMYKLATDAKGARRGDIPGTGPIDSSSAVRWTKRALGAESPEAIQMEQASKSVLSNLAMMRSGKTVTEQEYRRLMASYGLMQDAIVGGSEEAFWQGLNKFREDLKIIQGNNQTTRTAAPASQSGGQAPQGFTLPDGRVVKLNPTTGEYE